jgi:DNA-binding MarR family transcriptional regulator
MARKASTPDNGNIPDVGIGKLLRRAHIAFSRELRLRLNEQGVTFGEFIHLEKLWYEDGLNQTEISRRAGIETASSTKTLELLETRGFVRRVRNGSDRRSINVFLTPRGAGLETKLLACAADVNAIARQQLTKSDVLAFFSLMEKIAENLDKRSAKNQRSKLKDEYGAPLPR